MTTLICRDAGIVLFVLFSGYGLMGTLRIVRAVNGPRPWALFAFFELIEAVQVYGLLAGPSARSEEDLRFAAVVCIATLCFCAYLQRLYFTTVQSGHRGFPRPAFYTGLLVFIAIVAAAHYAAPVLP
jgi:hypothetical protein